MIRRACALAIGLTTFASAAQGESRLRNPVGMSEGVAAIMDAIDWSAAEVVELRLNDHTYEPSNLILEHNKPYIFKLRNVGRVSHDMVGGSFFSGIAIKMAQNDAGRIVTPVLRSVYVKRGQEMEIWFLPIRPGRYNFFCDIDDHREHGMEGEITIR